MMTQPVGLQLLRQNEGKYFEALKLFILDKFFGVEARSKLCHGGSVVFSQSDLNTIKHYTAKIIKSGNKDNILNALQFMKSVDHDAVRSYLVELKCECECSCSEEAADPLRMAFDSLDSAPSPYASVPVSYAYKSPRC